MSFCVSPQPASLRTCSGSILPKNRMRTCRVFSRQTSLREQCVKPAHVRYDGTTFTMPIQETLAERELATRHFSRNVRNSDPAQKCQASGRATLPFELDGDLVDLRRQDEVVLAQSTDGVGPELDGNLTIAFEMQVGMMTFLFGQGRNVVEEFHAGDEVPDRPVPPDSLPIVDQRPALDLPYLIFGFGS